MHQSFETESRKPVLFAVFSFLEQFLSSVTVVSVAKANVLRMPTIAVFAREWSGADPNFAPFRWRIWLALSEFLCLLGNQSVAFVTLFSTKLPFLCTQLPFLCTQLPFFCTVLPKNCTCLSQSQWRNFSMYIINQVIVLISVILCDSNSYWHKQISFIMNFKTGNCYLFNSITSKNKEQYPKKVTKMASPGASRLVGNVSPGANSERLLTGTSRAAASHYTRSWLFSTLT